MVLPPVRGRGDHGGVDAADRAELDELRRRAYGPGADIDGDPAASARLAQLEEAALHEREAALPAPELVGAAVGGDHPPAPLAARPAGPGTLPEPDGPPTDAAATAPTKPRRLRWTAVAAVAAVAVALAVGLPRVLSPAEPAAVEVPITPREAYTLARDPDAVPLLRIPLDGSFGDHIDLPTSGEVPVFPTSGEVEWAEPLGDYYGWDLWIAGADGALQREHCLLAQRGSITLGRCVPAVLRRQSALVVSIPFERIEPARRPADMRPDERLGFWWDDDREIVVLLAADSPR